MNGIKTQNNFGKFNNKTHDLIRVTDKNSDLEGNIVIKMNK